LLVSDNTNQEAPVARIAGFVLRSTNKHLTAAFYKDLGLIVEEEQHGGPKHYEVGPLSDAAVVEIYQSSQQFPHDTLMLEVESLQLALEVALRHGVAPTCDIKDTPDMRFVYVTDPDARPLMLIEKK
jgi:hypothetical protein